MIRPTIPQLFAELGDLPAEERAAALEALDRQSPAMARELRSLLAASDREESILERPAWDAPQISELATVP
ncbi:MAG: hypothetical protein ABIU84_13145, partial [Thermoanaerobaculia bacterium]